MREKLLDFIPQILSYLYQNHCICCKKNSTFCVCQSCINHIHFNDFKEIRIIENVKVYSCAKYEGILRKLILSLKFHNNKEVSAILSKLLFKFWQNTDLRENKFQVVPIPIHKSKKKTRGYDQTELVSRKFSFLSNNIYNPRLLERIKNTVPQYQLNKEERQNNLMDAFCANLKYLKPLPVVLIDDICTTGTTIKESIKTLNAANVFNIYVLTISDVDLNINPLNIE